MGGAWNSFFSKEGEGKKMKKLAKVVLVGVMFLLIFRYPHTAFAGTPGVSYKTHVQNVGWQSYVRDGQTAGTSGRSLRLEAIRVKLGNQPYSGSIQYRTHIQNIGWESSWRSNNDISGTSGRALRLEAIQIRLTGAMASNYNIYYRVHAQNIGWMGWACNGQSAGTAGYSYRLEAIQIKLMRKGSKAPGKTTDYFRQIDIKKAYESYARSKGKTPYKTYYVDLDGNGVQEMLYVGGKLMNYAEYEVAVCTYDRGKRKVLSLLSDNTGRCAPRIWFNKNLRIFGYCFAYEVGTEYPFYKVNGSKITRYKSFESVNSFV